MSVLYILKSQTSGRYYVGSTDHLERRLREHNAGQTQSTRSKGPWELVFSHDYADSSIARKAEIKLKRMKSRKIIGKIVRDQQLLMEI